MNVERMIELFLLFCLVVIGGLQVCVYREQAGIMRSQAGIADTQNRIIQAQQRPWVFASQIAIKDDMIHDANGLEITLTMNLKNSGLSVAQHTFFSFKSYLHGVNVKEEKINVCRDAENSRNSVSVFPGDSLELGQSVAISEAEFVNLAAAFKENNGGKLAGIAITVIACIAYKSSWEADFHHTPYLFALLSADRKNSLLAEMMINQHTIPASSFLLGSVPTDMIGSAD